MNVGSERAQFMAAITADKRVEMEEGMAREAVDQDQRLLDEFAPPAHVEETIVRWLGGLWTRHRSEVWLAVNVVATLTTRRLFRWSFPYPLHFTFLGQLISNSIFLVWSIYAITRGFRENRWQSKEWSFGLSIFSAILHFFRLLLSAVISAFGILFAAQALAIYPNFHTLALLPVLSYVCDSVLLHVCSIARLHPFLKQSAYFNLIYIPLIAGCCAGVIAADYRVETDLIPFALVGLFLESLSRTVLLLNSKIQTERKVSKILYIFERFVIGTTQLIVVAVLALKHENTIAAIHAIQSWGYISGLTNAVPAVLLLLLFNSGLNTAYRGPVGDDLTSVLEDVTPQGKTTLQATLHSSYLTIAICAFREEYTMLHWLQSFSFASLYILALGLVQVGYYPLRLQNCLARLLRRKPRHFSLKSWSLLSYLVGCTLIVYALLTCVPVYWVNTIAYDHSAKSFLDYPKPTIDYAYRPPHIRGMDIIVAHSQGHPHGALFNLLEGIRASPQIMGLSPTFRIFTKDSNLIDTLNKKQKKQNIFSETPNIGGPAATFLAYIVNNWGNLPTQMLFLASTKEEIFDKRINYKIREHFATQGKPVADSVPKSGFLNLGESQVCRCNECSDSDGWEDTFGLVPSMWTAARPNQTECGSVLLTYSNNFIVSAARIRGTKKDVWETLLRGLMSNDTQDAWAHDPVKLPKMFTGEEIVGKWAEGGVYGVLDSKEDPLLGKTIERLWGVLLQCSTPEIAWRCPNMAVGARIGGDRTDCGCIDELPMSFS